MIQRWLVGLLALAAILTTGPARADEFRPAYLQLRQVDAASYDVLWKVPALNERTILTVEPEFPPDAIDLTPRRNSYANGASVERWRVSVPGGLEGKAITFPGLSDVRIDVLARLARADGTVQLERIAPGEPVFHVKGSPGSLEVVQTYTTLGIEHILSGFDHLCFVLALVLIVGFNRRLIWTVTAFTLAHSVTLALATLSIIHVPGPPVEATIALSIVFVANEIVQQQRGRPGLATTKPWLVAFSFGLLHGLGFAGALAEIGLPANSIPLALLFFNVGVEVGQLLFVGALFLSAELLARLTKSTMTLARIATPSAYVVGGIASYWTIERIVGFW